MKKLIAIATLIAACFMVVPANAQSVPTPITIGAIGNGTTSFLGTNIINVYSVPITVGSNSGTFWMDVQGQGGFLLFRPPTEGGEYVTAQVTSYTVNSRNSVGLATSATLTYIVMADPNSDGDTDTVVGSITFNYTWTHNPRYYRAGWYATLTGGTGQQSITQD